MTRIYATGGRGSLPSLTSGEISRFNYLAKNSNLTEQQMASRFGISVDLARRIKAGQYVARDKVRT